jgi:hypothetical protein
MQRRMAGLCGMAAAAVLATPTLAHAAEGRAWTMASVGEGLKLAYGVPGTDDVDMLITCRPHTGRVTLHWTSPRRVDRATVVSAHFASRHPSHGARNEAGEGWLEHTDVPTADPVFRTFARTGVIGVRSGTTSVDTPGVPRRLLRRFTEHCG